jgi:hypothetical protein
VLKFNYMPSSSKGLLQNFEVIFVFLSKVIALYIMCNLNTSFINIYAMSVFLLMDLTQMKLSNLVNLSTTMIMESCCLKVFGRMVIKSTIGTSQFCFGRCIDYNNPLRC